MGENHPGHNGKGTKEAALGYKTRDESNRPQVSAASRATDRGGIGSPDLLPFLATSTPAPSLGWTVSSSSENG